VTPPPAPRDRILVGVSACLLGQPVRYDGGHKHDLTLVAVLGAAFEIVPLCPEVECDLPTPRDPMRLEEDPGAPRLVVLRTRADLTSRMATFADRRVEELVRLGLCGFVFKARSPSCGPRGVPVYDGRGAVAGTAAGLFADRLRRRLPDLPIEDESTLGTPEARERFALRVLEHARARP
jgi:uncharacterized protein YbbK (DUF523 family)